ncbi:hypothetical protein COT42_08890 [Candidatus Saganbacteria bacterium CG08_land_8_20_14_0_20_45_16]|uniref:Uncharacterized protein n=1 Tax=Candidatus Saganbacteria bacterium CG08_land_8_20_14_0_20_45_16 TaxID=2014293 RepID=A0A2H0XVC5_UNCSA|nr:MAG: hypothetical protein COT42_08890 [Candidatus Saganbacteria bacterium CG08_land_8_20_14_0_20_45_16]
MEKIRNQKSEIRIMAIVFGLLIMAMAGSFGCARTVTSLVTFGEALKVEVTFRGPIDADNNRYFLILSDRADYRVPLPQPDVLADAPELIEPGTTPQSGSQEAYYANFFSSWSGYAILEGINFSLVKGPFVLGLELTREVVATLAENNNKLSFTFSLERLFATLPSQIYYDVVAVPWPNGEVKIPADHLPSIGNSISKVAGAISTVDDTQDDWLAPSLDIIGCRLEVQ